VSLQGQEKRSIEILNPTKSLKLWNSWTKGRL